jgi:DNA processing protein
MSTTKGWFSKASPEDIISLSRLEQLNPIDCQKIRAAFPDFVTFDQASAADLRAIGLTENQASKVRDRNREVGREMKLMRQFNINLTTIDDSAYPLLLREIADPPLWLFSRGDINICQPHSVTIVGTRKPSSYANNVIEQLLPTWLISQLVTVSGLAYGVDVCIHRASLKTEGKTVAVLAGGLDAVYPGTHQSLAEEIVKTGGALISEYPPLVRPQPYRFPIRNRIGAGLSPLTIVIEAQIKSGTLTTARSAVDYGRDVWAVPGRVTDLAAQGANFLIKSGAMLFDSADQLAEFFQLQSVPIDAANLDTAEAELLHLLTDTACDLDELVAKTGRNVENILGLITRLELTGSIFQDGAGRYSVKKHG